MQEIKKVVQERYEAEKRRKEKRRGRTVQRRNRKGSAIPGMEQRYISITKWDLMIRRTEGKVQRMEEVKKQVTYTWRNIGGSVYSAVCRDGEVVDLIQYVNSSSSSYRGKIKRIFILGRSSSGKVGSPHRKMSMTYMIMMILRTFTTIMKMDSTALRMRKITGVKLNK